MTLPKNWRCKLKAPRSPQRKTYIGRALFLSSYSHHYHHLLPLQYRLMLLMHHCCLPCRSYRHPERSPESAKRSADAKFASINVKQLVTGIRDMCCFRCAVEGLQHSQSIICDHIRRPIHIGGGLDNTAVATARATSQWQAAQPSESGIPSKIPTLHVPQGLNLTS